MVSRRSTRAQRSGSCDRVRRGLCSCHHQAHAETASGVDGVAPWMMFIKRKLEPARRRRGSRRGVARGLHTCAAVWASGSPMVCVFLSLCGSNESISDWEVEARSIPFVFFRRIGRAQRYLCQAHHFLVKGPDVVPVCMSRRRAASLARTPACQPSSSCRCG